MGRSSAEIDESFCPEPVHWLKSVTIGDELVLLDGHNCAQVLNPSGTAIWSLIDGSRSVSDIAAALDVDSEFGARVSSDILGFVRQLGALGVLAGVQPERATSEVDFEPVPDLAAGDEFPAFIARDENGDLRELSEFLGDDLVLVNWNPSCGYCSGVANSLGQLEASLAAVGATMLLVATGDAQSNRSLLDQAGVTSSFVLAERDLPFGSVGTPSAVQLDSSGVIARPPAHGAGDVIDLVRAAAGLEDEPSGASTDAGPRYLFERHSVCAPGLGVGVDRRWADSCVVRIEDHHVGVQVDSVATREVIEALLPGARVDDPRAGHSFSLALPDVTNTRYRRGTGEWNQLVQPGRSDLRSRDPARVLRGLLLRVREAMDGPVTAPIGQTVSVNAIAVQGADGGIGLIPASFYAFGQRLQPLLARSGLALVDVRFPRIDLSSGEVVVADHGIDIEDRILDEIAADRDLGRGELPGVLPGRYPLAGFCVALPGPQEMAPLSPAQAAAAALSFVGSSGPPSERLGDLALLFDRVPAHGVWYYSDVMAVGLVAEALGSR